MLEFKTGEYVIESSDVQGHYEIISVKHGDCLVSVRGNGLAYVFGPFLGEVVRVNPLQGESLHDAAHRVLTREGWESPWHQTYWP